MELRKCEYGNTKICVWDLKNTRRWKKYRVGNKKAIFLVDFLTSSMAKVKIYSCEGCIRQLAEEMGILGKKKEYKVVPLTKRAKKILILLKLK